MRKTGLHDPRTVRSLVLGLSLALVIGACGGGEGEEATTTEGTPSTEEPTSTAASESTTTAATETTAATSGDALLDELIAQGYVDVGLVQQPPFSGITPEGDPEGVCPVMIGEILAELGVAEMQLVAAEYADMVPGLQSDRWDIAAACLRITPERCAEVIFSDPIEGTAFSFAVPEGNPNGLLAIQDLIDNPDLSVGLLAGSTEIERIIEMGVSEDQITQFPDVRSAVEGLTAGRIDAALTATVAFMELGDPSGYEVTDLVPDIPQAPAGVAFRMEDEGLRDAINGGMTVMKDIGRFDELLLEYGFLPEVPKAHTTEDLCAGIE